MFPSPSLHFVLSMLTSHDPLLYQSHRHRSRPARRTTARSCRVWRIITQGPIRVHGALWNLCFARNRVCVP